MSVAPNAHDTVEAAIMMVDAYDWAAWKASHVTLYGHAPKTDVYNKVYCTHPMHQEAARLIAGADIALRHEAVHPRVEKTIDDHDIDGALADQPVEIDAIREFRDESE